MSDTEDRQIGYGRPPVAHQFKKGQSENPKGRTRGSKGISTVVNEIAGSRVEVMQHGVAKAMSAVEAVIQRLKMEALRGNPRAIERFLMLAERHHLQSDERPAVMKLDHSRFSTIELTMMIILIRKCTSDNEEEWISAQDDFIKEYGREYAIWEYAKSC